MQIVYTINNNTKYIGKYKIKDSQGNLVLMLNHIPLSSKYTAVNENGAVLFNLIEDSSDCNFHAYSDDDADNEFMIIGQKHNFQVSFSPFGRAVSFGRVPLTNSPFGNLVGECPYGSIELKGLMGKREIYINNDLVGIIKMNTSVFDSMIWRNSNVTVFTDNTDIILYCLIILIVSQLR